LDNSCTSLKKLHKIKRGEGMNFSDGFFKRVEKKTSVGKDTILDLAKKIQQTDMKNEGTLREIIHELSTATGRTVSKEKEDKIISAVVNDQIPKDLDKYI
jgi:hypothetical protein